MYPFNQNQFGICQYVFMLVFLKNKKKINFFLLVMFPLGLVSSPSPILLNCGIPPSVAANALRLSVGRGTTKGDVDVVIEDLRAAVQQLEGLS